MDYIRKLPLLMAVAGAMIIGLVGYSNGIPNKENILKMLIIMVLFYIVGLIIRNTITGILEELERKAKEKEVRELEEQRMRDELERQEAKNSKNKNQTIDFVVDDDLNPGAVEDDFDALPVADFIKKELNK